MKYAAISVVTILWLVCLCGAYRQPEPIYRIMFNFELLVGIVPIGSIWACLILEARKRG